MRCEWRGQLSGLRHSLLRSTEAKIPGALLACEKLFPFKEQRALRLLNESMKIAIAASSSASWMLGVNC
jgi:hypothetical protein